MMQAIESFKELDRLIFESLHRIDYKHLNRESQKLFVFYLLASIVPSIFLIVLEITLTFDIVNYYLYFTLALNHAVHIGFFQVFLFVNGVQNRLRVISRSLDELRLKRGDNVKCA